MKQRGVESRVEGEERSSPKDYSRFKGRGPVRSVIFDKEEARSIRIAIGIIAEERARIIPASRAGPQLSLALNDYGLLSVPVSNYSIKRQLAVGHPMASLYNGQFVVTSAARLLF